MEAISISKFPKNKIYILLNQKYRGALLKESMQKLGSKNYFELSRWINKNFKTKFNGGDIKYWIEGKKLDKRTGKTHPKFMPLWLMLKLAELNKEKIVDLQKYIIAYRSGGKGLIITNPIIPIKVTPELESIVIHMFGDGAAGDFTPSYTQKNKRSFNNFIKKLKNCFGEFNKSIYFTQGKHQIKFPKAITDVISEYYSIKSYRSYDLKIPGKILKRSKQYKLACIISFIVDEGYVRDVIIFYSSNQLFLSQIRHLVLDCGYSCSEITFNKTSGSYIFALKNKDIIGFYNDVERLSKKFPTCNLSFKREDIEFIVRRTTKKNPRKNRCIDSIILNLLRKRDLTTKQISKDTGYAHCTILHHLEKLYILHKVKRKRLKTGAYIWNSEFQKKKEEEISK